MKTYVHIPFSIFSGNQNNDGYTDPSLVQLEYVRCEQGLMKRSTLSVFLRSDSLRGRFNSTQRSYSAKRTSPRRFEGSQLRY